MLYLHRDVEIPLVPVGKRIMYRSVFRASNNWLTPQNTLSALSVFNGRRRIHGERIHSEQLYESIHWKEALLSPYYSATGNWYCHGRSACERRAITCLLSSVYFYESTASERKSRLREYEMRKWIVELYGTLRSKIEARIICPVFSRINNSKLYFKFSFSLMF